MNIVLNGNNMTIAKDLNLSQLLQNYNYHNKMVAVEINGEIVPKSEHNNYLIKQKDKVEIINAVGGG